MLTNRYEPETTRVLRDLLAPSMIVLDVGAHIGYFTRLASKQVGPEGHVYAYEADEENYGLLSSNTRNLSNVTPRKVAISSNEGSIPFYHLAHSTGLHSTVAPYGEKRIVDVEAKILDFEVERLGIKRVDLIKMDIEGGEWKALQGMQKLLEQKHLKMIVEWNPEALASGGEPIAFLEKLTRAGFSLFALTPTGHKPLPPHSLEQTIKYLDVTGSVNILCTK